jgi:hypothetical protein
MTRRDLVLQTLLQTPLALLFLSCARPTAEALRPLLNSERIELIFGDYGLDVLELNDRVRVSSLYSLERGRKVCRTFALVFFPPEVDPLIAGEQRAILAGGSIGAVFKEAGFEIEKLNRYFGELPADPRRERLRRLMGEAGSGQLALHVYSMVLRRGGESLDYATIAEVHHPAFLDLEDLEAIYGSEVAQHRREAGLEKVLAKVAEELQEAPASR